MSTPPTLPKLPDALEPLRVVTHDGSFHADEVFALAALRLAHGVIGILRSRDPEVLAQCDLRVDVGRRYDPETGDFDHHQGDAGQRSNGIKYASFGLVWKQVGEQLCGSAEIAAEIDGGLVAPVDAADNGQELADLKVPGVAPYTLGRLIGSLGPQWDDPDQEAATNEGFGEALRLADGILRREIAAGQARARAKAKVREAIAAADDPRLIELPSGMPWKDVVVNEAPDALVVMYERSNGSWGIQAVPAARTGFDNRRDLPAAWAGLEGEELAQVTGVADATFCHIGRFMAVARSREGALALARRSLQD